MSTNCLKTQLKGVVNNNNLLKFDEIRLMLGENPNSGDVSLVGSTFEVYNASGVLVGTTANDIPNAPNGCVKIFNKSLVTWFAFPNWKSVKEIKGFCCPLLQGISLRNSNWGFDIENLKYCTNWSSLLLDLNKNIVGNIKHLQETISGSSEIIIDLHYNGCTGNVEDIQTIRASTINLSGTAIKDRYGNGISTTNCLESFAAAQVTRGRISGTCKWYLEYNVYKTITFDPNVEGGYSYE